MSSEISQQGMLSILDYECDEITNASSLRRTLSADMSSKPWLAQNGFIFSPMKRIASSEELTNKNNDSSSSSYEPSQSDIWASIVSQKANDEGNSTLPPQYVHPLVKRSTSALSEKSLEICTESLGSETGSDKFSSYAPSETGDTGEDQDVTQVTQLQPQQEKEWQPYSLKEPQFAKYNFSITKKSPPKFFPPLIPTLAQRDGPSFHMQPRREDGRLVLEAVSIPSQNCLRAHRQDGRLLLTLANDTMAKELDLEDIAVNEEDVIDEVDKEVFYNFEGEDNDYVREEEEEIGEEEEEDENDDEVIGKIQIVNGAKELRFAMDRVPNFSREVINVHRSALVMKRLIGLNNRDPKWTEKIKKAVDLGYMEMGMEAYVDPMQSISQSLPKPPMVARLIQSPPVAAAAASFNACDYFWRTKPSMESAINPLSQNNSPLKMNTTENIISPKVNKNGEMLLMRGNKGDYLVPLLRGCMENKKPLLFWEPYCITTS